MVLSAIFIIMVLLALGFLCSKRTRKRTEQRLSEQSNNDSHRSITPNEMSLWSSIDRSSSAGEPSRLRTDSVISSLGDVEKKYRPSVTAGQCEAGKAGKNRLDGLDHLHFSGEGTLPLPSSQATAWQEQPLDLSMRPHSPHHRRQHSLHSIDRSFSARRPPHSKIQSGRQWYRKEAACGSCTARTQRHFSTLATILEPEAALHAVSPNETSACEFDNTKSRQ